MTDNNADPFEDLIAQLMGASEVVNDEPAPAAESGVPAVDEAFPRFAGHELPSVHTQGPLLQEALDSDDIDHVKAVLEHVWCHYQGLEFALSEYDFNAGKLQEFVDREGVELTPAVAAQVLGRGLVEATYETAHDAGRHAVMRGVSQADGLRAAYGNLDFGGEAQA